MYEHIIKELEKLQVNELNPNKDIKAMMILGDAMARLSALDDLDD